MGGGKKKEKKKNKAVKKRSTATSQNENDTEETSKAFPTEEVEEEEHSPVMAEKTKSSKDKKKLPDVRSAMQNFSDNFLESIQDMENGLEDKSEEILNKKIFGILSGAIPVPGSYEDSEQTPLEVRYWVFANAQLLLMLICREKKPRF